MLGGLTNLLLYCVPVPDELGVHLISEDHIDLGSGAASLQNFS